VQVDAVKRYGEDEAGIGAPVGVTIDVPSHRFTASMGPSGSGKRTLGQYVAGLYRPTPGPGDGMQRRHRDHRAWSIIERSAARRPA